jgi:hypothetical protein
MGEQIRIIYLLLCMIITLLCASTIIIFIVHLFQWAYGVTCWEIFSGGKVPYPSVNLIDLPRYLASGHRQEQPNNYACNDEM